MVRTTLLFLVCLFFLPLKIQAQSIDSLLLSENKSRKVTQSSVGLVDDLAFIRRTTVDLIGRIPRLEEVKEYESWPESERRQRLVEKLIEHPRFADRWTVFFADLLRLRSNVTGGAALIAHVNRSIRDDLPYNQIAASLIATNGKAGRVPEVGFILGDDADPLAMASVTAQVFMGVRIGCAQCHDHPFDVWSRKDFYGVAAYFGKTQRFESNFTRVVYTSEVDRNRVLWPPEDEAEESERKAMTPSFPFPMIDKKLTPDFIARYEALMKQRAAAAIRKDDAPTLADLFDEADGKLKAATSGTPDAALTEARNEISKIDVKGSLYKKSEYRESLAKLITSPRNRLFAESFVNRVWHELIGRGFVEPVDDFREDNPPSHPKTLEFIADEFVANGYSLKQLIKTIVLSKVYQQKHVPTGLNELKQEELEASFLATRMRRMLSESLYDSIVTAGHLFDVKYRPGENEKTIEQEVRVLVGVENTETDPGKKGLQRITDNAQSMENSAMEMKNETGVGYSLENAIELDFDALLKKDDEVQLDRMVAKSNEELEAERMQMESQNRPRPNMKYEMKTVQRVVDDNPRFNSALRMATPAPVGHFIRIFGQTSRIDLGEPRDDNPSMRQSLMMLNGRLINEASRVGTLEPIHRYLSGTIQLDKAIQLAYLEILTRKPSNEEIEIAKEIVAASKTPREGIADLRWIMLNSNEFRFLP